MSNKLVKLNCMSCGTEFMSEEPQMCCSGRECGCMGIPIDPIVCSEHCYYSLPFLKDKYLVWIETSKELPSYPYYDNENKSNEIELIVRYEQEIVGFDEKEIICSAFYSQISGFYISGDSNFELKNVTHFMYMPKSPMIYEN